MPTVQSIIDYAKARNPEFELPSSTEAIIGICNRVNTEFYEEIVSIENDRYAKTDTIDVISGTDTYTKPTDFWRINGLEQGIYNGYNKLSLVGYKSREAGFYFEGDNIIFTPTPTADRTYHIRYTPNLPEILTLDAPDTGSPAPLTYSFTIPDSYKIKDIFVWFLSVFFAESIGDEQNIDLYNMRKEQLRLRLEDALAYKPSKLLVIKR